MCNSYLHHFEAMNAKIGGKWRGNFSISHVTGAFHPTLTKFVISAISFTFSLHLSTVADTFFTLITLYLTRKQSEMKFSSFVCSSISIFFHLTVSDEVRSDSREFWSCQKCAYICSFMCPEGNWNSKFYFFLWDFLERWVWVSVSICKSHSRGGKMWRHFKTIEIKFQSWGDGTNFNSIAINLEIRL